jgi:predicted DCC family thiol-disulfide oxidoreductase YuxK
MRGLNLHMYLVYIFHFWNLQMTKTVYPLTLFYDSRCPLCVAEMKQLQSLDAKKNLRFEDIYSEDFGDRFPHIDPVAADRILHAEFADGQMLFGLDVTHRAWVAVEKKRWIAVLRWPLIRWFADIAYLLFARNRYTFSFLLTGTRRCVRCEIGTATNDCGSS